MIQSKMKLSLCVCTITCSSIIYFTEEKAQAEDPGNVRKHAILISCINTMLYVMYMFAYSRESDGGGRPSQHRSRQRYGASGFISYLRDTLILLCIILRLNEVN